MLHHCIDNFLSSFNCWLKIPFALQNRVNNYISTNGWSPNSFVLSMSPVFLGILINCFTQFHEQNWKLFLMADESINLLFAHLSKLFPWEFLLFISLKSFHDKFHECSNGDRFLSDLNSKFIDASVFLFSVSSKTTMFENFIHIFLGKESIETTIILSVFL